MNRHAMAALLASAALCAQGALAQNYPARTVRLVVPSSPGGGTDITARILAQQLSVQIGQQVVVDNRPGAGSIIGNDLVAKAAPDGYTLLMGISTLAIIPSVYKNPPYNAINDLAPISQAVSVPNALVLHPSVPAKTVKQLIALAKSKPGALVCGSAGTGTSPHLSAELFKSMAHLEWVHVPYKGAGPGLIGLLAGEIDLMFPSVPSSIPYLKSHRLRALGVTTAQRTHALPDVPAIAEAGLPGYEATQWFGVLSPAGTPHAIVDYLHKEIVRALRSPDVTKRLADDGAQVVASSPQEFSAYLKSETEKWANVIKSAGIKTQ